LKENGNWELRQETLQRHSTAWSFSFTDKEKEALYLTKNDIPVKSTEMTAPRLIVGAARDFRISNKLALLAEANLTSLSMVRGILLSAAIRLALIQNLDLS
jgi:hypothetical protein